MDKKIKLGIVVVLLLAGILMHFGVVSADCWQSFSRGSTVDFCAPWVPDRYVDSSNEDYCVSYFNSEESCYGVGNLFACNTGGFCDEDFSDDTGVIVDGTAPALDVLHPVNGSLYTDSYLLLNIGVDEMSDITYLDVINGRGRWTNVCRNCMEYGRDRRFNEGMNHLKIRAEDARGNVNETEVVFFVDSTSPRIYDTMPGRRDSAIGVFSVEYEEFSVENVSLYYGNFLKGFRSANVEGCPSGERVVCDTWVNLSDYAGDEINYKFIIRDEAGNVEESRETEVEVPIFAGGELGDLEINLTSPVEGELYTDRRVPIGFSLNREAEVEYLDLNDNRRARWRRVCRNCMEYERDGRFDEGENDIMFRAVDEWGKETYHNVSFFVDSRGPRLRRTEPRRGFANGFFSVEFYEDNPEELMLHYGNYSHYQESEVNLSSCVEGRRGWNCETFVDLSEYDGQEIEYWFILRDIAGNMDESRKTDLDVDNTFPVIGDINYTIERRRVEFKLEIEEQNLDVVEYIDYSDRRPRFKRMCSRLREGICEDRVYLREGVHNLVIQVADEAGNIVTSEPIIINMTS